MRLGLVVSYVKCVVKEICEMSFDYFLSFKVELYSGVYFFKL